MSRFHIHWYTWWFTFHKNELMYFSEYECRCGKKKIKMGFGIDAVARHEYDILKATINKTIKKLRSNNEDT